MLDTNEYINKVNTSRSLIQLGMCNLVKKSIGEKGLATYFRGGNQIDGIFQQIYWMPGIKSYPNLVWDIISQRLGHRYYI